MGPWGVVKLTHDIRLLDELVEGFAGLVPADKGFIDVYRHALLTERHGVVVVTPPRKGSPWLRRALTEAAHGAARTKNKYLSAQYHRIAARRGSNRAITAVGHSILTISYHLLTRHTTYQDLGQNYFDERDREGVKRRAIRRLEHLGFQVTLAPLPHALT